MKLVLDYIYGGAMYLCGAHMQYVIQVMEVLQLKCGVSVNKMVKATEESQDPAKQWIEIEHSTMHIKEYDSDHCKSEDESDEKIIGKAIHSNHQREEKEKSNVPEVAPEEKGPEQPESTEVPNNVQTLNKERRLSSRDEDSEDDNDVVMVELDEDFVVERVNEGGSGTDTAASSQEATSVAEVVGEQAAPTHRCVLCGRTFNHYDNLQVHLTGHLGVKVHINRCNPCQKNFKNKNELDLHMRSHKFAKMLGKYRIHKSKKANVALKKKIISTVGSSDKKIVRKYVKKRDTAVLTREVEKVVRKQPHNKSSSLTCAICDKGFGVRSIFVRHVKKFHPDLSATMLQSLPQVNVKKCKLPPLNMPSRQVAPLTNGHTSSKPKRTPVSPKKFQDSYEKYENPAVPIPDRFPSPAYERSYSSPAPIMNGKTKVKSGAPKTPKTPKTVDYYSTLECPDCSKVFVAKSIFERHLQSAKHGHFASISSPASEGYPQWPSGYGSPLAGYKSPLGGYSSPSPNPSSPSTPGNSKIDCHLCGQTFVRVKDLVKHREKVCSAYHNMKKQS